MALGWGRACLCGSPSSGFLILYSLDLAQGAGAEGVGRREGALQGWPAQTGGNWGLESLWMGLGGRRSPLEGFTVRTVFVTSPFNWNVLRVLHCH